jgi:hypothetical protein
MASITSKQTAIEVARLNLEADADKYIRLIEAGLSVWDGSSEIKIEIPERDYAVGGHLAARYKQEGWSTTYTRKSGPSRDWWLVIK